MTPETHVRWRLPVVVLLALLAPAALSAQTPAAARAMSDPAPATPAAAAAANGVAEVLPSKPLAGAFFTEIQLRDLPSSRSLWSLVETADQLTVVDRIDNGGLYTGEPRLMGSLGSSWTQTGFTLDGLDVTNPARTGIPLVDLDPQVLSTVHVVSSLPSVDLAGGGPSVALVPRAPARQWGGSLQAAFLPNRWQASPNRPVSPAIAHFGSAGEGSLLVSGPVGGDARVLLSGRRLNSRRFERDDPTALDSRLTSVFAHAAFGTAAAGQLRLIGSVDAARRPFAGRLRYADRSASATDRFLHLHGVWEKAAASGTTWSATAGYDRGTFGTPAESEASATLAVLERLRDGPVAEAVAAAGGIRQRVAGVFRLRPVVGGASGGRHTIDLGLSLARTSSVSDPMAPAMIGERVDGLPARAWAYTWDGGTSHYRATEVAGWINDQIRLWSRASLEVGARYESTRASARDNPTSINWLTVLPRGLLRIGLNGSGTVTMFTGYGMYRHRLPLDYLAYGDAAAVSGRVYRWTDPNGDGQLQASEAGALIALTGPGRRPGYDTAIDPDLLSPRTDEFTIGFEARFGRHWRGRLAGIEREMRRFVAPVNTGVTVADYTSRDLPDRGNDFLNPVDDRPLQVYDRNPSSFGRDRAYLTNPADHDGYGVGVDLVLERVFDGRWYMLFGASAQRSDGYAGNPGFLATENDSGVQGALFLDPNAASYARGRLFFERGYIIKWSGGFVTKKGVHFGAVARYQDGQHFARQVVVPDLNQGPEAIQAYTRGHSRFTFSFTLDARVEKGFRLGGGRLALVGEAFNLLNNAIEVEEDPVVTRRFRATTAVQPPRAIRVGVRLDF